MFEKVFYAFMQWLCYPPEFRISSIKNLELSGSLKVYADSLGSSLLGPDIKSEREEELLDMVVDVGTLVWRVKRRLYDMGQLPKEMQRISRDLQSTWDAFSQRGIEIRDHTGETYVSGMAVKVITSQPMVGLSCQKIIETLGADINVLDISGAATGPVIATILGTYGATVVRVESANAPDLLRLSSPYKDNIFGLNRAPFNRYNYNKYSLAVDLTKSKSTSIIDKLAAWADVSIQSLTVDSNLREKLSYDRFKSIRSDIIYLNCTIGGESGPPALSS